MYWPMQWSTRPRQFCMMISTSRGALPMSLSFRSAFVSAVSTKWFTCNRVDLVSQSNSQLHPFYHRMASPEHNTAKSYCVRP